jgi:hypothetical protein
MAGSNKSNSQKTKKRKIQDEDRMRRAAAEKKKTYGSRPPFSQHQQTSSDEGKGRKNVELSIPN